MRLEYLPLAQMSSLPEADCRWLEIAGDKTFSAVQLVQKALEGEVSIFRIVGEAEGIVVLGKREDELHVEAFAGKGILKNFPKIYQEIRLLAGACGASKIVGWVRRPGLNRIYERHTAGRPEATVWVEELPNGT